MQKEHDQNAKLERDIDGVRYTSEDGHIWHGDDGGVMVDDGE